LRILLYFLFLLALPLEGSNQFEIESLTLEEKIGQLIVIQGHATGCPKTLNRLLAQIARYHVGGVLWMRGDPGVQRDWIAQCQAHAALPLLMMQDLEWGMRMRFDYGEFFPKAPQLGRHSTEQIAAIAEGIGRQCREVGIQLNLAPVADVDMSHGTSFLAHRCFGSDPEQVAHCALAYLAGLARAGVLGCAKHFPGHGGAFADSHHGSTELCGALEPHLLPFRALIAAGVPVVLVGHIVVPSLDPRCPATLSYRVVEELLRRELGFGGVIITDALDMAAVTRGRSAAQIGLQALETGCDLLLAPTELGDVFEAIEIRALEDEGFRRTIDEKVQRVLTLKENSSLIRGGKSKMIGDSKGYGDARIR
jgi:beta-N-acetylhexosaminidase